MRQPLETTCVVKIQQKGLQLTFTERTLSGLSFPPGR